MFINNAGMLLPQLSLILITGVGGYIGSFSENIDQDYILKEIGIMLFSYRYVSEVWLFFLFIQVYVPDEFNAILGRSANKQVFEGLTTGLLRITTVVFECLISTLPDGNNQSALPKIIQDVKNKPSQVEAFNSRIQDLIR